MRAAEAKHDTRYVRTRTETMIALMNFCEVCVLTTWTWQKSFQNRLSESKGQEFYKKPSAVCADFDSENKYGGEER